MESVMLAIERRNFILEKLQDEKKVVVSQLSSTFNVSEETIRRDLEKLEKEGYATKSYGGAVLNENVGFDMPLKYRSRKNVAAKERIAAIATQQIHDGDHIFLDASSTDFFIARAIRKKQNLTVVTNSIEILLMLADVNSNWTLISTGGTLKNAYLSMIGPQAEATIGSFYADKAFISCKAIDENLGIFDSIESFSSLKRKMIDSAAKSYLCADSTKFGKTAFTKTGKLDMVDAIITDSIPDARWKFILEQNNITCISADEVEE